MKSPPTPPAYRNDSDRFIITSDDFERTDVTHYHRQYVLTYLARVNEMTPMILSSARRMLDPDIKTTALSKACVLKEKVLVIGVILKKMKYRRSVLYEFLEREILDLETSARIHSKELKSDEDWLESEDDGQTTKLGRGLEKHDYVTGNVIGIYGQQDLDTIHVDMVILPELAPQLPWPTMMEDDWYVMFISGMALESDVKMDKATSVSLNEMILWLTGMIERMDEEKESEEKYTTSRICRIILAGDSCRITHKPVDQNKVGYLGKTGPSDSASLARLDETIARMAAAAPVDLVPGPGDPAGSMVPQQPLPRVVFHNSRSLGSKFQLVTNPYRFEIGGFRFLGTSGQNINDVAKYTNMKPRAIMESTLNRRHIFPTVPDTVNGWPLQGKDPLILDEMPHVYFAGNQEKSSAYWMDHDNGDRTRLLRIPRFDQTKTIVLLNLKDMKTHEYDFSGAGMGSSECLK